MRIKNHFYIDQGLHIYLGSLLNRGFRQLGSEILLRTLYMYDFLHDVWTIKFHFDACSDKIIIVSDEICAKTV